MQTTEVAAIVGRATVGGDVDVRAETMPRVEVSTGQPVHIRFPYRVDEQSKLQERWTFTLVTRSGQGPDRVAQRRHKDRFVLQDSIWAMVEERWIFDAPGAHVVFFEAGVRVEARPWVDDTMAPEITKRSITGQVEIIVH